MPKFVQKLFLHGSYNLEKVLSFSSRLEKSLNSVKVLEKYWISFLRLEKTLKFNTFFTPHHFLWKLLDYFAVENLAYPRFTVKLTGNIKFYFCFFILNAISIPQMHLQVIPRDCCHFAKCCYQKYYKTRTLLQRVFFSLAWWLDREMRRRLILHETGFTR